MGMRVTVHMVDSGTVDIQDMDADTIQPLIEALSDDDVHVLALVLDDVMTYVLKRNVTRVDVA